MVILLMIQFLILLLFQQTLVQMFDYAFKILTVFMHNNRTLCGPSKLKDFCTYCNIRILLTIVFYFHLKSFKPFVSFTKVYLIRSPYNVQQSDLHLYAHSFAAFNLLAVRIVQNYNSQYVFHLFGVCTERANAGGAEYVPHIQQSDTSRESSYSWIHGWFQR